MQYDKEVVITAVERDRYALQFASSRLRQDSEFRYILKGFDSMSLGEIETSNTTPNITTKTEQITNKVKLITAVEQDGKMLRYASYELRNDMEVVLHAVQENGLALQYASDILKNNQEIVRAAVKNYPYALRYASNELKNFQPLVTLVISYDGMILEHVSPQMQNTKVVVLAAVQNHQ